MNRNLFPIMLMLIGVLLIVGALAWAFSQYSNATQPEPQVASAQDNYPDIPRVSASDAKGAFDSGNAVFVDIREPEEYEQAHIPGAILMPLAQVPVLMGELDPEDWIITY